MRNWKTVLTSNGDTLVRVSIQCRIFQGDLLPPLLFIIILIPLHTTLNSTNYGYLFSKETPINHLLFMDRLKLYGKRERELQSLVYSSDNIEYIDMKLGMDKCSTVRMKKGKIF